ncbi:amidase family protein [Nocardioides houyundeii]|uniref:amidase family protein n=1 Tax=Nocardioides houyundeii TaxID=2045452 RepID=UPI0013150DE0|nr:amidase family protein [Nocardioides houyundeii]
MLSRTRLINAVVVTATAALVATPTVGSAHGPRSKPFVLEEATVASIHQAFKSGSLTCSQLVDGYLTRIQAYENQGPAINSLITVAVDAKAQARALDVKYRKSRGKVGPLHCIPVILKDNIDTKDMPTTAGSKTLLSPLPARDSTIARKFREDGALILGKGNLDEWAHGGRAGYSSAGGQTLNPYDLSRSPSGSSGGPAAAIAANFAVLSIGSDTLGSIRGPVNAESLAGVRPTKGLVSRAGIVPFSSTFDAAGPMTRTVTDSALVLNTLAGYDPGDPATRASRGRIPRDYTSSLRKNAFRGARIGVLRNYVTDATDPMMDAAVRTMRRLGATVVDDLEVPADALALRASSYALISETEFRTELGEYLAAFRPGASVSSHQEVYEASSQPGFGMAPEVLTRLASEAQRGGKDDPAYVKAAAEAPAQMRSALDALLRENDLDALVRPTDGGSDLSAFSGYPDVLVQGGVATDGTSAGLAFLAEAFTEPRLLGYAYAYEQEVDARLLPAHTPPIPADWWR